MYLLTIRSFASIYRDVQLQSVHLIRFFRWLYSPQMTPAEMPKPEWIRNIMQLKRKEKSLYTPGDMWTTDDDLLFLQHCPSKRVRRCYHAIARNSTLQAARNFQTPHQGREEFYRTILKRMPQSQSPQFIPSGKRDMNFENQRPFTI